MIVKLPSGRAKTVTRLQVGTPADRPRSPVGTPFLSKTCHATDPPRFQPIPSVHTSVVSPRSLPATAGCFRPLPAPGAATGSERLPVSGSMRANDTCPSVSHAARTPSLASPNAKLLIGHTFTVQDCTRLLSNVFP